MGGREIVVVAVDEVNYRSTVLYLQFQNPKEALQMDFPFCKFGVKTHVVVKLGLHS